MTCKEKMISYYAKFGFKDEGVSDKSTHGNVVWHQMRLTFEKNDNELRIITKIMRCRKEEGV